MAAKRIDPLKAKEAKQKKIAIGGAILLLALLAYQGPKTLKMIQGPQAVSAPTSTAPAATTPSGTAAPAGDLPAAPAPELSAVADSDPTPAVEQGQLATFDAPEVAAATSISVNGLAEDVAVEASFPKEEPTFVLVEIAENGRSVEIGIAGGEYANGGGTITLALGKKITLQNTADGSRYELELLAIQGQPVPAKK